MTALRHWGWTPTDVVLRLPMAERDPRDLVMPPRAAQASPARSRLIDELLMMHYPVGGSAAMLRLVPELRRNTFQRRVCRLRQMGVMPR